MFLQVLSDSSHIHIKELRHQLLGQPDSLILLAEPDGLLSHLDGENQELGGGVTNQSLVVSSHGLPSSISVLRLKKPANRYRLLRA